MPRSPSISGRIVKLTGDGVLAEFPSVVNAVACAIEIQTCDARARSHGRGARSNFASAINLGDVIVEGDDIYGDGVNVAARLESLAQPGRYRRFAIGPRSRWQPARRSLLKIAANSI